MSQFCIDLKDVMLPDAIAALVEAWYEAQEVEAQVALRVPADLAELISQIMSHVVQWKDAKGRSKKNTVAELLEIRKNQARGSRSNVGAALWSCGITYCGGHDDSIRLKWSELPIAISCPDDEIRLQNALFDCPGAKRYDYDHSVLIPVKYFWANSHCEHDPFRHHQRPSSLPAVISANNKDGMPYQPGEPIEIRDSAAPGSAWKRGWVFYKACPAKVGICEASKWNYELGMPDYIASGGGQYCGTGDVFINSKITGCRLKQPENIRRVIVQPWENQPAQSFAG